MSDIPVVHFGPGRLGLGLIVDVLLSTRHYAVYLVGAPGRVKRESTQYWLRFSPSGEPRERRVTWAGNPSLIPDELPPELVRRLTSKQPVLVTAALGSANLEEARPRIDAVLSLRSHSDVTVLLACENDHSDIYDDLAAAHPHVQVLRCVVDRICAWDDDPGPLGDGRRILAHDVAQWVIPHAWADKAHPLAPLAGLHGAEHVILLHGAETAHRDRKLWIVNGLHMILATLARRYALDRLPLRGEPHQLFRASVKPLMLAILEAVEREHGLAVDEHFADERVRAFCEAPDSASRVLAGRYRRADLRPYMQRLRTRLGAAAAMAHAHGIDTEPFLWAFAEVAQAISESDSFLDVTEPDPQRPWRLRLCPESPLIDADIDAEVEAIFADALSDWAPIPEAGVLIRRVRSALATWRSH